MQAAPAWEPFLVGRPECVQWHLLECCCVALFSIATRTRQLSSGALWCEQDTQCIDAESSATTTTPGLVFCAGFALSFSFLLASQQGLPLQAVAATVPSCTFFLSVFCDVGCTDWGSAAEKRLAVLLKTPSMAVVQIGLKECPRMSDYSSSALGFRTPVPESMPSRHVVRAQLPMYCALHSRLLV